MTTTRCIHGLDSRFCAACNRAHRPTGGREGGAAGASGVSAADILTFLNESRMRATYGAVASVLGVPAQSVGAMLGERRVEASWVVNDKTDLPTGYEQSDWHPELLASSMIIRTGQELTLRLALWRTKR
jgi:alkylated DNA nucleotide flippase Atl1